MKRDEKLKLGFLYTHPIQYFASLSRALAKRPDVDFTCFFLAPPATERGVSRFGVPEAWGVDLVGGFESRMIANWGSGSAYGALGSFVNPGIVGALLRARLDALVLHGYKSISHLLALGAARMAGTRVYVRGDTWHGVASDDPKRGLLLRRFDGALAVGEHNRAFYLAHGVPAGRVRMTPYSVDNEYFRNAAAALAPEREALRRSWGIPREACCFLFVGRLSAEKEVAMLIEAFAQCRSAAVHLLVVGDGKERAALEAQVARAGIGARVTFAGFLDQKALPRAFVASDVFCLPSTHESWGFVVNESMNFGLPQMVSDLVGCAPDLVTAETGLVLPARDVAAWARAMASLAAEPDRRARLGDGARRLVAACSADAAADAIVAAVRPID